MKCPQCLAQAFVRGSYAPWPGVTVIRTHKCLNGHMFETTQMPSPTLTSNMGRAKLARAVGTLVKGALARAKAYSREQQVARLARDGLKPPAIARAVGITDSRVRQLINKLRSASDGHR